MRDHPTLLEAADGAETGSLWWVAIASLLIIFIGWGAPYVVAVALKPMAADLGAERSVPSLASALAYIGSGVGGIAMGWWADRAGAMWPAMFGSAMIGLGAMVASGGGAWQLYAGYGLMIGLLGNAGIFAPLMANTSRLFTRKRGTALALVASGQQVAGAIWPPVFRMASTPRVGARRCSGTASSCSPCCRRSAWLCAAGRRRRIPRASRRARPAPEARSASRPICCRRCSASQSSAAASPWRCR